MNANGIAGSPKMETWMVDLLFAQPGQARDDTAAAPSAPAVSVASGARSAVAPGTGQAITALQAGGIDAASDTASSEPRYTTVAQTNALVASNNAMTSAQISKALYSGKGFRAPGLIGATDTFATIVQRDRDAAQIALNLADDSAAAAAAGQDPDSLRAMAARTNAYADSMQKAFDNHTLSIQKMSDVPGLDYTQIEKFGGASPNSQPTFDTLAGSYDKEAMSEFMSTFTNGKQVGTPAVGGVRLLLTWTDDSLT